MVVKPAGFVESKNLAALNRLKQNQPEGNSFSFS